MSKLSELPRGRLFDVERPRSLWDAVGAHFPLALVSGLALLLALFVPLDKLPFRACTFLAWTGYPCPFCGSTRAFVDMAHGRMAEAFSGHPLAASLYLLTALVFAWHASALLCGVVLKRGRWLSPSPHIRRWLWALLALAVLGSWAWRLAQGFK